MRVTLRVKKQENHLENLGGGGGGCARAWQVSPSSPALTPPLNQMQTTLFKKKGALKVLPSDAREEPFLVPQRTIQSKFL